MWVYTLTIDNLGHKTNMSTLAILFLRFDVNSLIMCEYQNNLTIRTYVYAIKPNNLYIHRCGIVETKVILEIAASNGNKAIERLTYIEPK